MSPFMREFTFENRLLPTERWAVGSEGAIGTSEDSEHVVLNLKFQILDDARAEGFVRVNLEQMRLTRAQATELGNILLELGGLN